MKMKKIILALMFTCFSLVVAQTSVLQTKPFTDYQISSERYFTDSNGSVNMFVNVWGNVSSPGRHRVYDGIDFATLLSIVGGPSTTANLKRVMLYREIPDEGQLRYIVDLEDFVRTGDRSEFIEIKPNDTILVPTKTSSLIWRQVGTLNTVFSLLNLYFTVVLAINR
tara:strand:- start:3234 stop:3734 length:501 start_codon:yes stop_codon:yes gene_type:complete